ncbi:LysR family transcriptional regulator [uncultured Rhodoblastus sp.]|uniref:LysR family transcriptional regulator n=1 Tax=uncultured Rhodoblastus sp. TaxID=543037 RepID=UPI0025FF85F4|nr:LysR family transcriptional regulator [uncultured Rhodoblastus sp.]
MDWDKLRIFHAAAAAGSFTHAGETLHLSQSAVSRQVAALEYDLKTALFHRHARGLLLTEQGEMLFRTVQEVIGKLEGARLRLSDARDKPHGELKVTANTGFGGAWLAPRLAEFRELYPDIDLTVILTDEELDLSMREADIALRLREPTQPDLIRKKLFPVHYHAYASGAYLERFGRPQSVADLDDHRIVAFGVAGATFLNNLNLLLTLGREAKKPRIPAISINNIFAMMQVIEKGGGVGVLPDYFVSATSALSRLNLNADMPVFECWLAYPEEMKNVARLQAFRDFIVANAPLWNF